MFRVDLFHAGETTPSSPPLYACLATSSSNEKDNPAGCLFTVGRKNCTIILDKDKSVSREHLHCYLVSDQSHHHQPLKTISANNNDDEISVAAAARAASSQVEKDACAENKNHMTLLVSNKGKFGSVVLALAPPSNDNPPDDDNHNNNHNNNNDNTDKDKPGTTAGGSDSETDAGSDTEDESQKKTTPASIRPGELPTLDGMKWFDTTQAIVKHLTTLHGYSILLDKLTKQPQKLQANEECVVPGSATTILIQCGQTGSLLVCTRMELQICGTKWPKKVDEQWNKQLYCVGASLVEAGRLEQVLFGANKEHQQALDICRIGRNLPPAKNTNNNEASQDKHAVMAPTTYMVVAQRQIVGKELVAWNLDVPIVSFDFLKALLQRKTPHDAWPNVRDYDPPYDTTSSSQDKHVVSGDFWKHKSPNSARLWESCTFLNTDERLKHDGEQVVKAAGANVVQVYAMNEKEAQQQIQRLFDNPKTKAGLFTTTSNAKRRSKIVKWIKEQNIAHLRMKEITYMLCRQERLKDDDGNVLGDVESDEEEMGQSHDNAKPLEHELQRDHTDSNTGSTDETKRESKEGKDAKRKRGNLEFDDPDEEELPEKSQPKKSRSSKANDKVQEDNDESQSMTSRRSRQSRDTMLDKNTTLDQDEDAQDELPNSKDQSQKKKSCSGAREKQSQSQRGMEILPSVQEDSIELNDTAASLEEGDSETKGKRKRSHENHEDGAPKLSKRKPSSRVEQPLEGSGTSRLESTADGWLIAAPKDATRRQAYLKPRDEILESQDNKQLHLAETVVCSGLVFRKYDPNRNTIAAIGAKPGGGKDFKKFRKNLVIKAPRSARIELRCVLPKETERLRQLEEQQRVIDEAQKVADELFNGGGGKRQSRITKTTTTRKGRNG